MSARSIRRSHEREEERRGRRAARRAGLAVGAVAATAAIAAPGAQAANFPVSTLANLGAGSLRAQITAANGAAGADTITFTGGATSGEITLATEIPITDDLTITGPGAGQLAISGDSDNDNVRDFATSNVALGDTRIFNVSDPSSPGSPPQQVSISGLTLKEGVADSFSGTLQDESGGAVYATDTAVTLTNVTLTDNVATDHGGAVYVRAASAGSLTATGSTFSSNRALDDGGAVAVEPVKYDPDENKAGTTISSSTFTGNRTGGTDFGGLSGSGGSGGALATKYEVQISDTTITGNSAVDGSAGGAYLAGYGTVQRSTIAGNTADDLGGGVLLSGVDLRSSTVSGNSTGALGGGVMVAPGFAKYGGAVARIDDSTVSGNSAASPSPYGGYGGGIAIYGAGDTDTLVTRNSTIAANSASKNGGGIVAINIIPDAATAFIRLKSTLVADNNAAGAADDLTALDADSGPPVEIPVGFAAGFSLIEAPGLTSLEGDPAGSNITGIDPKLSPLASNGGPTQTQAIAPTSPAVDSAQANGFTTDQLGQPRTVDAVATDAPLSDGTDIGAFELRDTKAPGGDPSTDFSKKPPKKVKLKKGVGKVKLQFTGTVNSGAPGPLSFECKVDKGEFTACKSPLKLKLEKGKHTVEVRAVDSSGRVDGSPAKAKIKVKKAKPKKK